MPNIKERLKKITGIAKLQETLERRRRLRDMTPAERQRDALQREASQNAEQFIEVRGFASAAVLPCGNQNLQ